MFHSVELELTDGNLKGPDAVCNHDVEKTEAELFPGPYSASWFEGIETRRNPTRKIGT